MPLTSRKAAGLQLTLLLPVSSLLICVLDNAAEGHGIVGGIFSLVIEAVKDPASSSDKSQTSDQVMHNSPCDVTSWAALYVYAM